METTIQQVSQKMKCQLCLAVTSECEILESNNLLKWMEIILNNINANYCLPFKICQYCKYKLKEIHEFCEYIERRQVENELTIKEEKTTETQVDDIKLEFMSDNEDVIEQHVFDDDQNVEDHNADQRRENEGNQVCKICNKTLKSLRALRIHISLLHQRKKFTCIICSEEFHSKRDFERHNIKYHAKRKSATEKRVVPVDHTCRVCQKTFKTRQLLKDHERKVHIENKFSNQYQEKSTMKTENFDPETQSDTTRNNSSEDTIKIRRLEEVGKVCPSGVTTIIYKSSSDIFSEVSQDVDPLGFNNTHSDGEVSAGEETYTDEEINTEGNETSDKKLHTTTQIKDELSSNNEACLFDDPLSTLLKDWNVYEAYSILKSKNITIDSLKYTEPKHLDPIFKNNIGLKIIFEHKLKIWQSTLNLKSSVLPFCSRATLEENRACNRILKGYADKPKLTPQQRKEIVHCIIQKYIDADIKISVNMFKQMAKEIHQIFWAENIETYFTQDPTSKRPKGKLYDRYYCRRRALRGNDQTEGLETAKASKSKHAPDSVANDNAVEAETKRKQLRYIHNWDMVLSKWKETFPLRNKDIHTKSLSEVFERWPLYKDARTPALVNCDFAALYDKAFDFDQWENLLSILPNVFEEQLKDPAANALFSEVLMQNKNMNAENLNLYYLKLLQAILTPSTVIENGKHVKHTIADSQRAFTVEFVQENDIDTTVDLYSVENQPLIFAIGYQFHYRQFVVMFQNDKYIFETYLEAIDFCFKLRKVFNLNFPPQCRNIWTFLQNFCYNMPIERKNPKIQTFISDLKNLLEA